MMGEDTVESVKGIERNGCVWVSVWTPVEMGWIGVNGVWVGQGCWSWVVQENQEQPSRRSRRSQPVQRIQEELLHLHRGARQGKTRLDPGNGPASDKAWIRQGWESGLAGCACGVHVMCITRERTELWASIVSIPYTHTQPDYATDVAGGAVEAMVDGG